MEVEKPKKAVTACMPRPVVLIPGEMLALPGYCTNTQTPIQGLILKHQQVSKALSEFLKKRKKSTYLSGYHPQSS